MKTVFSVIAALMLTAVSSFASSMPLAPSALHPSSAFLVEQVDGVVIPPRSWDAADCVGPTQVGCWWEIDQDCVDKAKQDYADDFNAAEDTWWAAVEPHQGALLACLDGATGPSEQQACWDDYNLNSTVIAANAQLITDKAAAFNKYMNANCCVEACGE